MDVGAAFVTWCPYRGWVAAEVTWTGGMYLLVDDQSASVPMGSSLKPSERQAAPAKPNGPSGSGRATRGSGLVSQTAMRA